MRTNVIGANFRGPAWGVCVGLAVLAASAGCSDSGESKGEESPLPSQAALDSFQSPTNHGALVLGQTYHSVLKASEKFHQWTFSIGSQSNVMLKTMRASDGTPSSVDTVMVLYSLNAAGKWDKPIESNDDGGGLRWSRIQRSLSPGRYGVLVKGYTASTYGAFALNSQCIGGGCISPSPGPDGGPAPAPDAGILPDARVDAGPSPDAGRDAGPTPIVDAGRDVAPTTDAAPPPTNALVLSYDFGSQAYRSTLEIYSDGRVVRTEAVCCPTVPHPASAANLSPAAIQNLRGWISQVAAASNTSSPSPGALGEKYGALVVDVGSTRFVVHANEGRTDGPGAVTTRNTSPSAANIIQLVNGIVDVDI